MKTRITLKSLTRSIGIFMTFFIFSSASAQQDVEIEDGKLIVNRISAASVVEIASGSATGDAQIELGDNGSATDAILGWDSSSGELSMTPGSSLGTGGGINIIGAGTASRIGLGTSPDANAKVFINSNSTATAPHLFLRENNSGDAARMHFGQFSVADLWQLSGFAGTNPTFTFTWDDNGTAHDVMTLDGDDGDVTVQNGDLAVKKTGAFQAAVEISTGGASSDALVKLGDDGVANDVAMGYDGGDEMFKISLGATLNNNGFNMDKNGSSDERFGLGTLPHEDAKVFINHNSEPGAAPSPHLLLQENNNTDFARLQFGNFGVSDHWHIAALSQATSGALMNFFYRDGAVGDNIMTLDGNAGLVGIQRAPATNALEVEGTASKSAAGDWLANSDRRIKTDIRDIENSFETMLKLHPVKFKYTDEWMSRNSSIKDQYYYNFIAQEYQQVFPEAVQGSGEYLDGDQQEILQIDTYNAQIVNMVATQDLIRENQAMKEEVASLRTALDQITMESQGLKAELQIIKSMLNQHDLTKGEKPSDD